jgi:hypothetical protein
MNDQQKPPELFAERPIRSDFARSSSARHGPPYIVRRFITIFVIFTLIGGGAYWKFSQSTPTVPGEIPTIKAEGSYKQRPEQPGGIDIPHQDVQVYQELDNKGPPPAQVEHLLPPPETPQSATVAPPAVAPSAPPPETLTPPPEKVITTATQPTTVAPTPAPTPAPVATTATQPDVSPSPAVAVPPTPTPQPVIKKKASAPTPTKPPQPTLDQVIKDVTAQANASPPAGTTSDVAPAPAATPSTGGDTAIQLASIPDQASAQAAMQKLQTQYASILGSTQLRLVKADLGDKGIYYRIQSQPVSETQAKNLCTALKAKNAGCILVRQ